MIIITIVGIALVLLAAGSLLWARRRALTDRRAPAPAAPGVPDPASQLRHFYGLIAHELRTPLGAIVGYAELLGDGLLGPLPERAQDAVRRIGVSGAQLRHLVDGLSDLVVGDEDRELEVQVIDAAVSVAAAADSARALAAGRSVDLEILCEPALPTLRTDLARLNAAIDLAIGAAVRASPGASLRLAFEGDAGALIVRIEGTALDPARDMPRPPASPESGPALRLAMAARNLQLLGGQLSLIGPGPTTLLLRIPSLPPEPAPDN